MAEVHKNLLLVEGEQDKRTIPALMKKNGVDWGEENPIVHIKNCGGYEKLINPVLISTELKASGLVALGIIVDADDNPLGRWESVRHSCLPRIPDLPKKLPQAGLIHNTSDGIKFGVWIMPDNKMRGMLETFLAYLVPDESECLWQYAQEVATEAKNKGALYKDVHCDKAYIYTWLGWQNPPGRPLHNAVMERILNPKHPKAQTFVNWFKMLYSL